VAVYLEFQGWPSPGADGTVSRGDGQYSGIPDQLQNWSPGEIRMLVDSPGFDASAEAKRLIDQLGSKSEAFAHLSGRSRFGFKKSTKRKYETQ